MTAKRHVYRVEFVSQHTGDESQLLAFVLDSLAGWKRRDIVVTQTACDECEKLLR